MEQPASPMNPTPPVQNKPKKSGLLFLEVGLIGVFSVIFALILIFGTLNYFGLLPVSDSLPFLSFLPQKQKVVTNKTIKINTSENPTKSLPDITF